MKEPITIGQRIVAAVIAHQLGISSDRALKLYVRGRELDPSWEEVGKTLLANERASTTVPASARSTLGPQIVRTESDSRHVEKINPRTEREADVS
jgi:hypothetical protein